MNTKMLKMVRQNFDRSDIPRDLVRHNCRAWVRSIRSLGDKWLLAIKVEKGVSHD